MPPKRAPKRAVATLRTGDEVYDKIKKIYWRVGKEIGKGGFGIIYECTCVESGLVAVMKAEPAGNGPLFCEQNFVSRCMRKDNVCAWVNTHRMKYLPLPEFFSFGLTADQTNRYVVMQRLGRNLEEVLNGLTDLSSQVFACQVALEMLSAIEFMHGNGFAHADIKGSNILFSLDESAVYLCDFGLAAMLKDVYREEKKQQHNGTIEYTSRDAHKGAAPSRRGDFEILAYCLLHWLSGSLPWLKCLADRDAVASAKQQFFTKLPQSLKDSFPTCPAELISLFNYVKRLEYLDIPNYSTVRGYFTDALKKIGGKERPFDFPGKHRQPKCADVSSPPTKKGAGAKKVLEHVEETKSCSSRESAKLKTQLPSYLKTVGTGPLFVKARDTIAACAAVSPTVAHGANRTELRKKSADLKQSEKSSKKLSTVAVKKTSARRKVQISDDDSDDDYPSNGNGYHNGNADDSGVLYKTAFMDPADFSTEDEEDLLCNGKINGHSKSGKSTSSKAVGRSSSRTGRK